MRSRRICDEQYCRITLILSIVNGERRLVWKTLKLGALHWRRTSGPSGTAAVKFLHESDTNWASNPFTKSVRGAAKNVVEPMIPGGIVDILTLHDGAHGAA